MSDQCVTIFVIKCCGDYPSIVSKARHYQDKRLGGGGLDKNLV
jgi:hypothetical protein